MNKIKEGVYHVNARVEIDQLNETLGLNLPEGDYETLAGFILSHLGHIPRREEIFEYNNIRFTVTKTTRRKIEWVRIELSPETASEQIQKSEKE